MIVVGFRNPGVDCDCPTEAVDSVVETAKPRVCVAEDVEECCFFREFLDERVALFHDLDKSSLAIERGKRIHFLPEGAHVSRRGGGDSQSCKALAGMPVAGKFREDRVVQFGRSCDLALFGMTLCL